MSRLKITVKRVNGRSTDYTDILSFSFFKEAYTPYTSLTAEIRCGGSDDYTDVSVSEILFYIDEKLIHHGLVDTVEHSCGSSGETVRVSSRGFTSLLLQNQIEPGMHSDISLNKLMDGFYLLPYVTHEDNADENNYIFVKSNSHMWEGIVNLSYKLCGTYPYIRGTNCVRITHEQNPAVFSYGSDILTVSGCTYNYKRRISAYHMSDLNGDYGSYDFTDSDVVLNRIVRHKYLELDKQFLYEPDEALAYRDKLSEMARFRHFCRYSGYSGEDLFDLVSFGDVSQKRITSVRVTGSSRGVFTELGVYTDGFIS